MRHTYKVCRNAFYKFPKALEPRVHIVKRQTKKKTAYDIFRSQAKEVL